MNHNLDQSIKLFSNETQTPKPSSDNEPKIKVNESLSAAAFYYEKLRNAIDYQEEHLFLKNAVKRILKRKTVFGRPDIAKKLLHELVWARYFPNESLPESYIEKVDQILRKYAFIRQYTKSRESQIFTQNALLEYSACEIEELLIPPKAKMEFFAFVKDIIQKNINLENELSEIEINVQIDIAIERLLFKSDNEQIRFKLMSYFYPDWPIIDKKEAAHYGANFDHINGLINNYLKESKNSRIFKYIKLNIPPFIVIWDIINSNREQLVSTFTDEKSLRLKAQAVIFRRNREIYKKVLRALVRAIIFVFATKTVFAFLIEVPFELNFIGQLNYLALIVNILLPPFLMVVAGLFIKIPGRKNTLLLLQKIQSVVFQDSLMSNPLSTLKTKRSKGYLIFNFFYWILSLSVLGLVVYLLVSMQFNVASIILFFFFISLVSFLSFRIRSKAHELEVRKSEDTVSAGIFNFVLLPFVVIGKFLSDKWNDYNFTLFFWDFIIEAPFKTLMEIFESWLAFAREKREDFE